jgi:hypothetical protein
VSVRGKGDGQDAGPDVPSILAVRFMSLRRGVLTVVSAIIAVVLVLLSSSSVRALTLTNMMDNVSNMDVGAASDHSISFTTPTGVDAASDTITANFVGFSLSGVGVGDIDLLHGPTGSETNETLAASPAAGVWGVSFSGTTITFTAPTDAAAGEIAASDIVNIRIGTIAAGGVNQITNPSTADGYDLLIGGTFGDSGRIGLVVGDYDVSVSATVPATSTPTTPGGGGGGGNTAPPIIFNIVASSTSLTTLRVTWQTDKSSTSYVDYGNDTTYASGTVSDLTYVYNHSVTLNGLIPCKTYHFRVRSTDSDGNTATSLDETYTMPCDYAAPIISGVQAVNITDTSVLIVWNTNEPAGTVVEYGLTPAYGATGTASGYVTVHSLPIAGLSPGTTYHFRVISTDASGNTAVSADYTFTTLSDVTAPSNGSLVATPGNAQVTLTWTPPADPDYSGVRIVRKVGGFPTGPNDGTVIYQGNATSFIDTGLTNGVTYYYGAYAYDDNGNLSSGALASATPSATPVVTPPVVPPTLPPGVIPPGGSVTTTPPTPGTTIDVQLFASDGHLPLARGSDGMYGVLAGTGLEIRVPAGSINGTPQIVAFVLNGTTYSLSYDARFNAYVGRLNAPAVLDEYAGMAQAVLADGRVAQVVVILKTLAGGYVFERPLIGPKTAIPGATIRLFRFDGAERAPWDGSAYGQQNPIVSDSEGRYAFQVPPGRYYVEVRKEGYWTYYSPPVFIDNNVFGILVELIRAPLTPSEVISATSTPGEVVGAVAKNLWDWIEAWLKLFRQFMGSPMVRDLIEGLLIPALVIIMLLNTASAISTFDALAYLQLLFLEPLLLLGRKPKRWGIVYDASTKLPVDLAIVRLIHAPSNLIVSTRVTSRDGKFFFRVPEGTYRLEVVKPGYAFPSQSLRGKKDDGEFGELYFGERVSFERRAFLGRTIPLDALMTPETFRQVLLHEALSGLQYGVALAGLIFSVVAFLFVPTLPIFGVILVHLGVYWMFLRFRKPAAPHWGRVLDEKTGKPLSKAVVRLYEHATNRPLDTHVTDHGGRYGFRTGKNTFMVTAEAQKYDLGKTNPIDVNADQGVVSQDIRLQRKNRSTRTQ